MTAFDIVVQGFADILKGVGAVDAGTLVVALVIVAAIFYVAKKSREKK